MIRSFIKRTFTYILVIIAILFALIGYMIYFTKNGISFNITDLAYIIVKLFILETDFEYTPINPVLNIARFLAPLSLATAVIQGFVSLFSTKLKLRRIKNFRNHVIIIGDAETNKILVSNSKSRKRNFVQLIPDSNNIENQNDNNIISFDTIDASLLDSCGFYNANYIIISYCSDTKSLFAANEILKVIDKQKLKTALEIIVLFNNSEWMEHSIDLNILEQLRTDYSDNKFLTVHYIDYIDTSMRKLMVEHAPDVYNPVTKTNQEQQQTAIIGFNKISKRLIINLAINSHYINHKKIGIHLFTNQKNGIDEFLQKYQLKNMVDFKLHDTKELLEFKENVSNLYLVEENEVAILDTLKSLQSNQHLVKYPKVSINQSTYSISTLIKNLNIVNITIENEATKLENIIDESVDKLAQIIHNDYLSKLKEKDPNKPTHKSWEQLPDEIRNRNRAQADHIWIKLRSMNCEISNDTNLESFDFSKDERFEDLSKAEHNRWCAYMYYKGWKYNKERDDIKKLHPDLIPYEKLNEEIKQYDRNAIQNIPTLLKEFGHAVIQKK